MSNTITLTIDTAPARAALAELKSCLSADAVTDAVKAAVKVFFQSPNFVGKLFRVEKGIAAGTTAHSILKPTDRFTDFLTAIRTGKFDGDII